MMKWVEVSQIIKSGETSAVLLLITFTVFVYLTYYVSKRGRDWYIRPIEALTIMEEGLGRAAEMRRPVMLTPGMSGLDSPLTLAGISITGQMIERAAAIGVKPLAITSSAPTMMVLEAIAKDAYISAGKSQEYAPGKYVFWTGGEQFAYATYLMGAIMTEKPATIVFVGSFLSDIMMNAETGKRVGAVEVGGTLDTTAMATMAMVCDAVLVGEEIYAAAAVITKDKVLACSLAGQDYAFLLTLAIVAIGVIGTLLGFPFIRGFLTV